MSFFVAIVVVIALVYIFLANSYSCTHIDFYGCSALNILITGRKIWIWAPVSNFDQLKSLFPVDSSLNVFQIVEKNKVEMLKHQISWCIQEPGQAIYLPPLYGHLVINLEFSISLGMSFIFKNQVDFSLSWVREHVSSSKNPKKMLIAMNRQLDIGQLFSSRFLSQNSSHTASEISSISKGYSHTVQQTKKKVLSDDE